MTNIIPISEVRENLPKLVEKVYKTNDKIVITVNGKPKAAIVSIGFFTLQIKAKKR